MEKLNISYYKYIIIIVLLLFCNNSFLSSQGNCLIYDENSGERIACELSYRAIEYKQGSKESQLLFEKAIELGPDYAWAYYQKSVPYFKRGLLAEGVGLINKAIDIEPHNYLDYRAYWYFYNRSYPYCIKDLEELYSVHQTSYASTPGGEMEMRLLLAMAHAQSGDVDKGIYWAKNLQESYEDGTVLKGRFDHHVLGMLYFMNDQLDLAQDEFNQQIVFDEHFADAYYYQGLIQEKQSNPDLAKAYFQKALDKINRKNGGYSSNIFEGFNVFETDIKKELIE